MDGFRESIQKIRQSLSNRMDHLNLKLIVAFVVFSTLPLIILNHFGLKYNETVIVQSAQETYQANAKVIAQQIDIFVKDLIWQIKTLADNPAMRRLDPQRLEQVLGYYLEYSENFEKVWVVDLTGKQIAKAPDKEYVSLADRDYLHETLRTGLPTVSSALISRTSKQPIFVICIPITDEASRIIGVLGGSVSFRVLDKLVKPQEIHSRGSVFLTDQRGIMLWHPRESLVEEQFNASGLQIVQQLLNGHATGVDQFAWDGENYIGGYARITTTGWGVFVTQPYVAATQVLVSFRYGSLLFLIYAVLCFAVLAVFISHRIVQIEEEIRQAEKLAVVGRFAAGMAHEVRNPLTSAHGFLQLLKKDFAEGSKESNYINIALAEIARVNRIIRDFLSLAKPQEPRLEVTDLNSILSTIVLLVDNQAFLQGCEIRLDLGSDLPPIIADPNQLRQVFLNLIRNALEAMPTGGLLKISSRYYPEGKKVELCFQDTGPGIPKAVLKNIFQPFFTTKEGGTGLGLPISHRIIISHGGDIRVSSSHQGTEFVISLPIYQDQGPKPEQISDQCV